jgi:sec-independent protein translocase protein TatB
MFDFGFWELAIIAVIALVIVGPDKMPALARKAGIYAGKASKFINKVKKDINEELKADELKEIKGQLTMTGEDSVFSQAFKETKEDLEAIKREANSITDMPANTKKDPETEKVTGDKEDTNPENKP